MPEITPRAPGRVAAPRRSSRRKHFLIGSGVALAALTAILTVGFLATSGSVTVNAPTPANSSTSLVFTGSHLATWSGSPFATATAATSTWESTSASRTTPTWTLAVLANGDVTTGGDIAMVNVSTSATVTHNKIIVSVYLANAAQYSKDVTTYDLPIELACRAATLTGGTFTSWSGTWTWSDGTAVASTDLTAGQTFLTSNTPSLSWSVPVAASKFCEVSLGGVGTGLSTKISGAVYLATSTTAAATYSPEFYVTAQRA